MDDFFSDVWDFYLSRRERLRRGLVRLRDRDVELFCRSVSSGYDHVYICKLCMIFAGVLGERMPDHIHNRMILCEGNAWVSQYLDIVSGLRPKFLGIFNMNSNKFGRCGLGECGWVRFYSLR